MKVLKYTLTFSLLIGTLQLMAGGGWTQKKNEGYIKLGQYSIIADQYFNPEGNIIEIERGLAIYNTSIYAEYGISDRLTTVLYFPFFSRAVQNHFVALDGTRDEGEAINTIGDTDISLKYGLLTSGPIALSAKVTFGLPFGEERGGESRSLQTGDGEFNQMITIEASKSFYPAPFYTTVSSGYNNRTNNFSDEFRYGLELGYSKNKLFAAIKVNGIKPLNNGDDSDNAVQGVFGNNIEYLSVTPEVGYKIKNNFGFSLSVGGALYGKQVLATPAYEGGIFWTF